LQRNPVFYAATIASLVALGVRVFGETRPTPDREPEQAPDAILFGYAVLFATCVVWHKQPWPYFFVLVVPPAFVVLVWAIEFAWRAYDRFSQKPATSLVLSRPWIAFVPLTALISLCVLCAVYPAQRARSLLRLSNDYQQHMLALASALVAPDEYYLAAADMLYTRTQSSSLLRRVALSRQRELADHPAGTSLAILNDLVQRPPKILIHNERFRTFPKAIATYLRDNYAHFWGSIDLYAPRVRADDARSAVHLNLLFGGEYRWTSANHRPARFGVHTVKDGAKFRLKPGLLRIQSSSDGRLSLQAPEIEALADPRFSRPRDFCDVYGR
jgi:hypothetical protein